MAIFEFNFTPVLLECDARIMVTIPSMYDDYGMYQKAGLEDYDINSNEDYGFSHNAGMIKRIYPENYKYPTVYLMHGGGESCTAWYRNTKVERYAQEMGCMTVSVDLFNSFGSNMKHGYRYMEYVIEEVMPMVQRYFPSSPKREDNFILGFSMGAHVAMKYALNYPEKFAGVFSMSGAKDIVKMMKLAKEVLGSDGRTEYDCFGPTEEIYGTENDLLYLAKSLAQSDRPRPLIFHSCGEQDYGLALCKEFKEYLDSVGLENTFYTVPGVHDYYYTDNMVRKAICECFPIRDRKTLLEEAKARTEALKGL